MIIPSSYTVEEGHVHVGKIHYDVRSTELSEGEYQGRAVAIKRLKVNDRNPRRFSRYLLSIPQIALAQLSPSGCVEKSSFGSI